MRIEHVAIWTHNIDRLCAFYATLFKAGIGELYQNPRSDFGSRFVTFGHDARIEIMSRPDVADTPDQAIAHQGYAHLAISLGSSKAVDAMFARAGELGIPVVSVPRTTGDGYYEAVVLDPDCNRIELVA